MTEDPYKLPSETNKSVDTDEMTGEYICKKCNGWGYINSGSIESLDGSMTESFIRLCPDCEGGCVIDWAKRPTQN